ncbi:MAG: hypothetical protein IJS46_03550 [Kiritimatiellae bacterium]|nr:hypothetical protein [Kiritimatiellia bacterium]
MEGVEPAIRAYLVVGTDSYLVEECVHDLLHGVDPDAGANEFGLEKIDGMASNVDAAVAALEQTRGAVSQTGLFAESKTVWLRGVSFCAANDRTSSSESVRAAVESFRDWLSGDGVPEGTTLVVSGTGIAKNSKLFNGFKALEKAKKGKIFDVGGGDSTSAKKLVDRILAENKWKMSPPVLSAFVSRVGTDSARLRSECLKLFAYTAGAEPTQADVAEICALEPSGVAWEIQSAFGSRSLPRTLAVLHKLLSLPKASEIQLVRLMLTRLAEIEIAVCARENRLCGPDGRTWRNDLAGQDAAAVAALGPLDVFAKPSFQKNPVVADAAGWSSDQVRRARLALMRGHENLVSASVAASTVLEMAVCEALR